MASLLIWERRNKLNVLTEMLNHTFQKMIHTHSYIFGVAVAIPAWIMNDIQSTKTQHEEMMLVLLVVIFFDWVAGYRLAKKSTVVDRSSGYGINAAFRDFIIVSICGLSILLDDLFETKSVCFAIFTGAFIYQNFYSLLGNVAALGWDRYFPLWLFKIIEDEKNAKVKKYFGGKHKNEKIK